MSSTHTLPPSSNAAVKPLVDAFFEAPVERLVLPNGLTVILKEDHSADLASVQLWVKTGSIHEGKHLGAGISHYVEHMLFKGTQKRSYQQISTDVQAKGGYVNAYTTFDRTVYHIDLPSDAVETAVDVISDIAFNSTFDETETTKERDVILREIDMCLDDPDRQVMYALFETAFREHPYQHPVIGKRSLYEQLTREDLWVYYKARYVPSNMVLIMTGALDQEHVLDLVTQYFVEQPLSSLAPVVVPEEPLQTSYRQNRLYGDYDIVRGSLAFKIPQLNHPDTPALDVLANVLGSGQSSIFWKRLRDELKLVHYVEAHIWSPGTRGLFWVSYTCDADKREAAEMAILECVEQLKKETVSQESLDKAVRQTMVGEINIQKTISGQAARLGISEVVLKDIKFPKRYLSLLESLTPTILTSVAGKYLKKSGLTAVSLEPEANREQKVFSKQKQGALPEFTETTLPGGVRLLQQPWPHFPKVSIRVAMLGGPLFESTQNAGATSLLSTLLTKDTQSRKAHEIAKLIESAGGSFSEFSGNNSFGLSLEVLPLDLPLALDLLVEALCKPLFDEATVVREREAQCAQLAEEMDEIMDVGRKHLRQHFFGEHPYSHEAIGTKASLESLDAQALAAHYKQLCVASNLVISVAGSYDEALLLEACEQALASFPEGTLPEAPYTYQGPKPGAHTHAMDREQAVVFTAYPDPGIKHPTTEVGEVLDELFSGMSSQLFKRVREEKGLAYYVGSSRMLGVSTGMFYFYGGTHPDHAQAVQEEIQAEVQRVRQGKVTEEELKRCKTKLKAQKRMTLQTTAARSMHAALNALYQLPVNHDRTYDERIDKVTLKDLQDFADAHFTPEQEVKVVVGPQG